jgi:hypothetical protein
MPLRDRAPRHCEPSLTRQNARAPRRRWSEILVSCHLFDCELDRAMTREQSALRPPFQRYCRAKRTSIVETHTTKSHLSDERLKLAEGVCSSRGALSSSVKIWPSVLQRPARIASRAARRGWLQSSAINVRPKKRLVARHPSSGQHADIGNDDHASLNDPETSWSPERSARTATELPYQRGTALAYANTRGRPSRGGGASAGRPVWLVRPPVGPPA